ncbi:MAG: DUF1854 domain-containing protein [Fimbriimonadaceae bacterium]|nr:DUF1854 domain-containing protein [Fimbriimonadaceae bacterium]QYK57775.1 MAG: DUF1854 domain-containing protein [Fimbriimonadaceae bacterium]
MRLFYAPVGRLRLTLEERSYTQVVPAWAAPLSHPGRFLSLLDGKGKEILMIDDPATLSPDQRQMLEEELHRRYLTSTVTRILSVRSEFGTGYWSVETDRGPRDFVTQSLQENANWLAPERLLLTDVDGNRYDVPVDRLDPESRAILERTV